VLFEFTTHLFKYIALYCYYSQHMETHSYHMPREKTLPSDATREEILIVLA